MFPVEALGGAFAVIAVDDQLAIVPWVPLNVTAPPFWESPKLNPVIVTEVPAGPTVGETLFMYGHPVYSTPLLCTPLIWTYTFPVGAAGAVATIEVSLQLTMPA
jgi:hypothetical protein